MPYVTYIKEGKTRGRVTVGVSDREVLKGYSLSAPTYSAIGSPIRGEEISGRDFELILKEDEEYRCIKKALSLLSYADNNRRNLYSKLCRAGFSREAAASAVEECLSLGYINERRQLARLILREANAALKGETYVRAKLVQRGYLSSDIDFVLSELKGSGEIDFDSNFRCLVEKHGASSDEEIRKLKYKYGF